MEEGLKLLVHDLMDVGMYIMWHVLLFWFIVRYRKEIYKAMAGGNGIPQPPELAKLVAVFAFAMYLPRIIYNQMTFDWEFGLLLLGTIGVTMDKFNFFSKKENKPKPKTND